MMIDNIEVSISEIVSALYYCIRVKRDVMRSKYPVFLNFNSALNK